MTLLALACRALLAAAFLLAGFAKLGAHTSTYLRIQRVGPLPEKLARAIARWLAPFEIAVAIFLAVGFVSPFMGLLAAFSMLGFTGFLVVGRTRDSEFDCGCFGSDRGSVTWLSIARNLALAAAGFVVFLAGASPLSLDDAIGAPAARTLPASDGVGVVVATTTLLLTVLVVTEAVRATRAEAHDHATGGAAT